MSKWLLEGPVLENLLKDIVTDSIEKNSKFQYDSGMKPKIVRRSSGNCCEWCDKIAGTYDYPDVPMDVYRRHNNCNCTVEYYPGDGKKQDVWSKKWSEDKEVLEQRKKVGLESKPKNSIVNLSDKRLITQNSENIKMRLAKELDKLSEEEKAALNEYTGFMAQRLNSAIATGKNLNEFSKIMEILDSGLNKGIVAEDVIVQRKTIPEFMNVFPKGEKITLLDIKNLKGQTIWNEIYTSTALEPFTYLGRNVIIEMKVPAGYQGALYIKDIAKPKFKSQNEMLFKRGMRYIVHSVEYINGTYFLTAEVLP